MNKQVLLLTASFLVICFESKGATVSLRAIAASDHPYGSSYGEAKDVSTTVTDSGSIEAHARTEGQYLSWDFETEALATATVRVHKDPNGYSSGFIATRLRASWGPANISFPPNNYPAYARALVHVQFDSTDGIFDRNTIFRPVDGYLHVTQNTISHDSVIALSRFGSLNGSAAFAAVWGFQKLGSAGLPLPSLGSPPDDGFDPPVDIPQELSGGVHPSTGILFPDDIEFMAPLSEENEFDEVHFEDGTPSPGLENKKRGGLGAGADISSSTLGYYFGAASGSPNFSSFRLPNLAPDQTYRLWANGVYHDAAGDAVVDLTAAFPDGVSQFFLLGMSGNPSGNFPHLFAASFASPGVANFIVSSVAVPEPASAALAIAGVLAMVSCRRRARRL